jgi:hypothetical protein
VKERLAIGHRSSRRLAPEFDFHVMAGAGALRSTANDLLKYASANLGFAPSRLTPLMEKTHIVSHKDAVNHCNTAMSWMNRAQGYDSGLELLGHPGGTVGYRSFIGFDKKQGRAVVVLCNQYDGIGESTEAVGWLLLAGVRLTPQITAVLLTGNNNDLVGIGARLDLDPATHFLRIVEVYPHSPAFHAGLSASLTVHRVDGIPTEGKSLTECLALVRGKAGTKVRLECSSPERNQTNTVELTRQKIQIPAATR